MKYIWDWQSCYTPITQWKGKQIAEYTYQFFSQNDKNEKFTVYSITCFDQSTLSPYKLTNLPIILNLVAIATDRYTLTQLFDNEDTLRAKHCCNQT